MRLVPVMPRGVSASDGAVRFVDLTAGIEFDVPFELRCERTGVHHICAARLDFGDALALARAQVFAPLDVTVTVLPSAVERLAQRRARLGGRDLAPGRHRRDRAGSGLDLRELREYRNGDLVRHIAWKPSLRSRELLVRQHEDESSTQAIILLDVGSGMRGADGEILERAMGASLSLGLQLAGDGDAVGIYSFDDHVLGGISPGRSHLQGEAIARHLAVLPSIAPEEASDTGDSALIEPLLQWISMVDRIDLGPAMRRAGGEDGRMLLERYLLGRHHERIARWERTAAAAGFDVTLHGVLRRAAAAAGIELGWRAEVRYGAREGALSAVLRRVAVEHPRVRTAYVFTDLGGMIGQAGLRAALAPALAAGLDVVFAVAWPPEIVAGDSEQNRALREAMAMAERRQKQRRIDELREAGARVVVWGNDDVDIIASRALLDAA